MLSYQYSFFVKYPAISFLKNPVGKKQRKNETEGNSRQSSQCSTLYRACPPQRSLCVSRCLTKRAPNRCSPRWAPKQKGSIAVVRMYDHSLTRRQSIQLLTTDDLIMKKSGPNYSATSCICMFQDWAVNIQIFSPYAKKSRQELYPWNH